MQNIPLEGPLHDTLPLFRDGLEKDDRSARNPDLDTLLHTNGFFKLMMKSKMKTIFILIAPNYQLFTSSNLDFTMRK